MLSAIFLNDITSNGDKAWISDTVRGAIYEYSKATNEVIELVKHDDLASIKGLLFDTDKLIGGSIGSFTDLNDLGNLVTISLRGEVSVLTENIGKVDGIVKRGNGYLITDFTGKLLSVDTAGNATLLRDLAKEDGLMSTADLEYVESKNLAIIPDLIGSTVLFLEIPE